MKTNDSALSYNGPALFDGVPMSDFVPRSASDSVLLVDAAKKRRAAIFQELCDMDISRDPGCHVASRLREENGALGSKIYSLTGMMP